MAEEPEADVLVVGAGPTGLFLALVLRRLGVAVRIIDDNPGRSRESRAMAVQARTLEFYRQFGIADAAVSIGIRTQNAQVWSNGRRRAAFSFGDMGRGLSAFPYLLILAQDVHERFLVERLAEIGQKVEWDTRLTGLEAGPDGVRARVERGGVPATIAARWLVGCDGGSSPTRKALGIGFAGGTTQGLFYVADVRVDRPNDGLFLGLGDTTFSLMLPVRTTGTQRLIGMVPPELAHRDDLAYAEVGADGARLLGVKVEHVEWFATYRVHHRVADHFRVGRVFLAGDAGHIHSPVGGQGMNTGLGDAMNLGWKLAAVAHGRADPAILDTYETERIPFAQTLVATTDRVFGRVVARGPGGRFVRTRIAPLALRALTRFGAGRRAMFRLVSQTRIAYPASALSEGAAGRVRAGERLPWIEAPDNFAPLDALDWQLQVYGAAAPALRAAAAGRGLALRAFPFGAKARAAGLADGAAYLVRPDGHVGWAMAVPDPGRLAAYLDRNRIVARSG
jgi:2-polyprenyl-6-methoxyphenol hydroxylase-like FAD-dependent oxidoreductase